MYEIYSTEWNIVIERDFDSYRSAYCWAEANCPGTFWEGSWAIRYAEPVKPYFLQD